MFQTYEARRKAQDAPAAQKFQTGVPGPSIQELAAGARPSAEQMGHRVDLPEAIREKMESSFGADFSGVKLYESQTVEDAGANAMTQGSNIAFAPGKLDLTSTAGQALLGHELSHVVSQARGESAGHGFLADTGLESQADRQGMLAAQGESAYSGPVSPIGASSAVGASGPMQAKKKKDVAKDALAQGAVGDLPAEMQDKNNIERSNELMEQTMQETLERHGIDGSKLQNTGYYEYIKRRALAIPNAEEQYNFLKYMENADDATIKAFIRQDALATTRGMNEAGEGMNSEDFDTRANAYAQSGRYAGAAAALQSASLRDLLSMHERNAFNVAADNFKYDRQVMQHNLDAYSPTSDSHSRHAYSSGTQRRLRKKYREQRRKGNQAGHMMGNRWQQKHPDAHPSWAPGNFYI